MDASLARLAVSTLKEGCIGETVAAVIAAEQLARATDPAVRAALAGIAADEARHAELAWRTVAWAMDTGGPAVREAVDAALRAALVVPVESLLLLEVAAPVGHGKRTVASTPATTGADRGRSAITLVVAPAAREAAPARGAARGWVAWVPR